MPHLLTRGELVQTMLRDFDAHRRAIRAHDSEASEATWEACEQWVSQLSPESALQVKEIERTNGGAHPKNHYLITPSDE